MNSTPIRIQRSRQHKMVSPNGLPIVYVGRPSKWGNPYIIGFHGDRQSCFKSFKEVCKEWLNYKSRQIKWIKELKGKNLACWCSKNEVCHADILLEIANS